MAELTESYIKGFVETCFKAGVHEKQAAAMLDLVAESSAMEKRAAGKAELARTIKGLGQLASGIGNTAAGASKLLIGAPASLILKPTAKAIRSVHNFAMVEPLKHYVKTNNYLAALMHTGVLGGGVPLAGATAFQNWRANSDSKLADMVNDTLGDPELLVFGNGRSSRPRESTATYTPTSSTPSSNDNASPFNIPGTVTYTPGESVLNGTNNSTSTSYSGEIPERVRPLVDRHKELKRSIAELKRTRSRSTSATERSRATNNDSIVSLQEELDELTKRIGSELNDHNRLVGIEARDIAQIKADAARDLSRAERRDIYQSGIDLGDSTLGRWGNKALEFIGVRDTDEEAASRAAELRELDRRVRDAQQLKPGKAVDVAGILDMLNAN